jgi:hypothetical protein
MTSPHVIARNLQSRDGAVSGNLLGLTARKIRKCNEVHSTRRIAKCHLNHRSASHQSIYDCFTPYVNRNDILFVIARGSEPMLLHFRDMATICQSPTSMFITAKSHIKHNPNKSIQINSDQFMNKNVIISPSKEDRYLKGLYFFYTTSYL